MLFQRKKRLTLLSLLPPCNKMCQMVLQRYMYYGGRLVEGCRVNCFENLLHEVHECACKITRLRPRGFFLEASVLARTEQVSE